MQTGKMCIVQTGKMCIVQTATHPSMKEAALRAAPVCVDSFMDGCVAVAVAEAVAVAVAEAEAVACFRRDCDSNCELLNC